MVDLFSRELIFGGAYYWKEFCASKWVALDKPKRLRKQPKPANTNSPRAYNREGLLSEGFLRLRFGGLTFRGVYYYYYYFFVGGGGGLAYYRNVTVLQNLQSVVMKRQSRCKLLSTLNCKLVITGSSSSTGN